MIAARIVAVNGVAGKNTNVAGYSGPSLAGKNSVQIRPKTDDTGAWRLPLQDDAGETTSRRAAMGQPETNVAELGVTKHTLYRFVGPKELHAPAYVPQSVVEI
jgi:hypothetical protein